MHPLKHIRLNIFDMTQAEFAAIAGVDQTTVSRWEKEKGGLTLRLEEAARIRTAAQERGIEWDDSWFFTVPQATGAAA